MLTGKGWGRVEGCGVQGVLGCSVGGAGGAEEGRQVLLSHMRLWMVAPAGA